jgi:hypothetical protein
MSYFKPATQNTGKPPWNFPASGQSKDPVPVRQAPNLPPPKRPVTASPQQVDHFFRVPASDPGRGGNNPFSRAKVKP